MFRNAKMEVVKEEVSKKQSQLKRPMDEAEVMHNKDTITTTDLCVMIIKAIDLCMLKKIPSTTTFY